MFTAELEHRFVHAIHRHRLLGEDESVVVAVSGGLDSVVMLHLFDARGRRDGRQGLGRLHVAHLNHGLRGADADADAAFVRELSGRLGWPCTVEKVDVTAAGRERRMSIEAAGRVCRLAFFEQVCKREGIKAVAVGHHAGDNAETILHRMIRGTGVRGLGGIPRRRPIRPDSDIRLIRPMLAFSRADIERYGEQRQITFRHDASNQTMTFTRNRIRHEVLPLLRTFNPRVEASLLRLADQAAGLRRFWRRAGRALLRDIVLEEAPGRLVLDAAALGLHPRAVQTQLVFDALLRLGISEGRVTAAHAQRVAELASGRAGSSEVHLPGALALRQYSRLILQQRPVDTEEDQSTPAESVTVVRLAEMTPLPAFDLELHAEVVPADSAAIAAYLERTASGGGDPDEEWLDADRLVPPLVVRPPRPGDRFVPLGMRGLKKFSDFFVDEKICAAGRPRTPVLCDQQGPIWVVSQRIDDRVRLREETRRILRLRVHRIRTAS